MRGDDEQEESVDSAQPRLAEPMACTHADWRRDQDSRHHRGEDREIDVAHGIGGQIASVPAADDRANSGDRAGYQPRVAFMVRSNVGPAVPAGVAPQGAQYT